MNSRLEKTGIPLFLFVLAFSLRGMWGYFTHAPTLDTAVVGLMAMDIQEGARPLFFTGQGYMGALEAYLTAGIFSLLGADSFTMTLVPSFFGALWAVLIYFWIKLETRPLPAAAAAAMVAFPAELTLWYTTVPYGGYPEMYVFGTAMLLHASVRRIQGTYFPWKDALIFSSLCFLGVWTNLQIAPFLAVAGMLWILLLFPDIKSPRKWLPFLLVPAAFLLAFVPQILLSAENASSPPLFSAASGEQISKSTQALFERNLYELVSWKGTPFLKGGIWTLTYGVLLTAGLTGVISGSTEKRNFRNLFSCAGFLLVFSVLYFPHPMSGNAPRYLIAPFILVMALATSSALNTRVSPVRWVSRFLLVILFCIQSLAWIRTLDIRKLETRSELQDQQQLVDAGRKSGMNQLRRVGSGMEGHMAAASSFLSGKQPVFTSSYDERRRAADLAWHSQPRSGYFFKTSFLPFMQGSNSAMNLKMPEVFSGGSYRVMPMPEIPFEKLSTLRQILPETQPDLSGTVIRITFPEPVPVAGLRLVAPEEASLPYQYKIKSGDGTLLAECSKRLGTSYISGDRVYFKGYSNQSDLFWNPVTVQELEFQFTPGRLNKLPVIIEDFIVFSESGTEPEPLRTEDLHAFLDSHPDAVVVASDGLVSWLTREGLNSKRLPLPWNPRDPDAQQPEFELSPDSPWILLQENRYGAEEGWTSFGPVKGKFLPEGRGSWKRFMFDSK